MKKLMVTLFLATGLLFGGAAAAGAATLPATAPLGVAPLTASSDCYPGCPGTTHNHLATHQPTVPADGQAAATGPTVTTAATGLAYTGTDAALTVGVGVLLLAAGLVLVRVSRRRQTTR
jgi:ABC-type transport system substrate-binding protein